MNQVIRDIHQRAVLNLTMSTFKPLQVMWGNLCTDARNSDISIIGAIILHCETIIRFKEGEGRGGEGKERRMLGLTQTVGKMKLTD